MRDLMLFLPVVLLFDIPSIHKTAGKQVIPAIHCRYPLFFKSRIDKMMNAKKGKPIYKGQCWPVATLKHLLKRVLPLSLRRTYG